MSAAEDATTTECAVLHRHYGVRSWITFNPPVGTKDGDDDAESQEMAEDRKAHEWDLER